MLDEDAMDWDKLRAQSLRPGGFGNERTRLWPALLGVHVPSEPPPYTEVSAIPSTDDAPHPDERQVRLDTDRSFVIYPADDDDESRRAALQSSLNSLIVSLLRKRRKLHYFQGYHDIVTVLFLTLPPELQLPCVEKLSLHRVRDSMGLTLEPVLGLLRIMRNLLRVVDPQYAKLLESVAPLPFHALSNLLTLFSHEVPTLPLIQHVWDFLLCREPLAVVWLAVAVVLVRKPDVLKLAVEGEDGMIHSVLNALPPLDEGFEIKNDVTFDQHIRSGPQDETDTASRPEEAKLLSETSDENPRNELLIENQQLIEQNPGLCLTENGASYDDGQVVREEGDIAANDRSIRNSPALSADQLHEIEESAATKSSEAHIDNNADIDADIDFVQPPQLQPLQPHILSHSRPCTPSTLPHAPRSNSCTQSRSPSFSTPHKNTSVAPISLPSLLTHAAQLLEAYPPTLPELRVNDILGPKSVVHTWRPCSRGGFSLQSDIERDDEAESWVGGPDVVFPCVEDEDIEESETERKTRKDPVTKRRRPFLLPRMRLRFGVLTPAEKRVLLVGAVVIVGLAIAVRQNRGLADMKKGWIAWAYAFVGGIRSRTVLSTGS
ncbi:hypothetical protein AZE42_05593 [Rhizopogon vesiculosus]|uniref:Rab-GAP TBC domain-containing protein n=1 Tax=Rhizopogon vesiculosus TaxID=180088 RepID=A0A1J8Q028_9AGAM|nr:hypothetical protein AZE42_05593 [Rhizopogon vesiculosus]